MGIPKSQVDFLVDVLVAMHRDVSRCFHIHEKERLRDELTIRSRVRAEGLSFLTKTLPSLGKMLDQCLARGVVFSSFAFSKGRDSVVPRFLGWLLCRILHPDGTIRSDADPLAVKHYRQVTLGYYKLELPFNQQLVKQTYDGFIRNDKSLHDTSTSLTAFAERAACVTHQPTDGSDPGRGEYSSSLSAHAERGRGGCSDLRGEFCSPRESDNNPAARVRPTSSNWRDSHATPRRGSSNCPQKDRGRQNLQLAADLIRRIIGGFDHRDIVPRHGPGAVATGERGQEKMWFRRFYPRLHRVYPYDSHMFFSLSHLCDELGVMGDLEDSEPAAKLIAVPKDSRGPRLISCEPLEIQWIQQGLARKLVDHLESRTCPARGQVNFTKQSINQDLALAGSRSLHGWVTLDMKDASDLVSSALVCSLFRHNVALLDALWATRSTSTVLPSGECVWLRKFAPMGSALCFPVEALCFYALSVSAIAQRQGVSALEARHRVFVYGDDIVVMHEDYPCVTEALERVGLKLNGSKCCTTGNYRESCGVDAFKGVIVTPTKFRKLPVWSRRSHNFVSWVEYSNSLWERGYYSCADHIRSVILRTKPVWTTSTKVDGVTFVRDHVARPVPGGPGCRTRWNASLQRREYQVLAPSALTSQGGGSGWSELLRVLPQMPTLSEEEYIRSQIGFDPILKRGIPPSEGVRAYVYPVRRRVKLKRRWIAAYAANSQ